MLSKSTFILLGTDMLKMTDGRINCTIGAAHKLGVLMLDRPMPPQFVEQKA
jgi:hypothetical protein